MCVCVCVCRLNFGDLSSLEAESLLWRPGLRLGTFLVRNSSSSPGCQVLSVRTQKRVLHYIMRRNSDGGLTIIIMMYSGAPL